jgi:predicted CXXCH cytochrome family protein
MSRIERVSVCARCHLQGDARIVLTAAGADLPPVGADLLTHVGIWGGPSATTDIGFVSHVERLVRSRCFTATADWGKRAMSCETCHNPHRTSRDAYERARVRAACVKCHAEGSRTEPRGPPCSREPEAVPRGADCVGCHMRLTPVFDLTGIRIHDHRIVARPPAPSRFERSRPTQAMSVLERFAWPDVKPPLSGDPGLELLALSGLGWSDAALERVDAVPAPQVCGMPEYHFARGKLLENREMARVSSGIRPDRSRMEAAALAYERALMLQPNAVEVTMRLVPVWAYLGRTDEALVRINEVITACPDAAAPLRVRALVHLARRDPREAARDHEAAHAKAPNAQGARELADMYLGMGDAAAAEHWRAEAARLETSRQ